MGAYLLCFAGVLVLVSIAAATGHMPHFSKTSTSALEWARIAVIIGLQIVVGIGLVRPRKWAALALSTSLLYPAFWLLHGAIKPSNPQPGDANWLGYIYASLLLLPAILTVKYWNTLIWRDSKNQ